MEVFPKYLSWVADSLSIFGAVFALFAWWQSRKLRQEFRQQIEHELKRQIRKISVVLQYGSNSLELPVGLRRGEFTRAEVLGRIGMIPMKKPGQRFSLGYLNTEQFYQRVNQIMLSDGEEVLTIPCTQSEFEQFDLS